MNELCLSENMMSTKEIAESLGVSVDTVQNAVKTLQTTSENFPKFKQGQRALYNEVQVTAIKLELQNHSKVNALTPKTQLEKQLLIKQAMQLQDEIIAELTQRAEAAEASLDRLTNAHGEKTVQEVAKILGYGSNNFFSMLRGMDIFYRDNGINLPRQQYINSGYFFVKAENYTKDGKEYTYTRIFVTAKGMGWLEKKLKD